MTIYAILTVVSCIAVYWFASLRSERRRTADLKEFLKAQSADLKDWQNKALIKHGSTPLGATVKKVDKKNTPHPYKILTRGHLQQRAAEQQKSISRRTPKPAISSIVAKAREIKPE